jgi:hypothetical protein
VGYQSVLELRLHFLNQEAHNIIEWAYKEKERTGRFPKDLTGYVFLHPSYQQYIDYGSDEPDTMGLGYYVGTTGTSHTYDTERGWDYYPD